MNILFGFTWEFNPRYGGTERVTDILARVLSRKGHNIYYLNTVKGRDNDYDCPAKECFYIPEKIVDTLQGKEIYEQILKDKSIDIVINQGGLMGTCKFLTNTDICKKIVVIHFDPQYGCNYTFNTLSALRNDTYIEKVKRIVRCLDYCRRKRKLENYLNDLYSYWFETADKVCLLSECFYPDIYKVCKNVDESKLMSINNPNAFNPTTISCHKKKQVLWVGRLDMKQKRPDRIIKIWKNIYKKHLDWNLIIAGDGEAKSYLEKKSNGIPTIKIVGNVNLIPYYEESEIICMTSTTEGWGMVLTEAMNFGTIPMAFYSSKGLSELLKNEIQIVEPFDLRQYSCRLEQLMNDRILRDEIRRHGYEIVDRFRSDIIGQQWERNLQSLIS